MICIYLNRWNRLRDFANVASRGGGMIFGLGGAQVTLSILGGGSIDCFVSFCWEKTICSKNFSKVGGGLKPLSPPPASAAYGSECSLTHMQKWYLCLPASMRKNDLEVSLSCHWSHGVDRWFPLNPACDNMWPCLRKAKYENERT